MFRSAGGRPNRRSVLTINLKKFTASGTYVPSPGLLLAILVTVGGGGGGGDVAGDATGHLTSGGGGSGSRSLKFANAITIGRSQAVTIGGGGAGGPGGGNSGAAGGDTSIGSLCIGKGGAGGHFAANGSLPSGGPGGVTGTGDIVAPGNTGGGGFYNEVSGSPPIYGVDGDGGASVLGGGTIAPVPDGAGTSAVANSGAGGSGAAMNQSSANHPGGTGGSGFAFVIEICLR